MELMTLKDITFSYDKTPVLKGVSASFDTGKIYAIVGRSGAGKTTLLSVISGLAKPDSGCIAYKDTDVSSMDAYDYRSNLVGIIFQDFNLLTKLTAVENVLLSMSVSKHKTPNEKEHAYQLLERVGLSHEEADRRVLHLSGGQRQRVAIARALSYDPDLVLADEPTGNLDERTQADILQIFKTLRDEGKCVIIVTHSRQVAQAADEILEIKDGALRPA